MTPTFSILHATLGRSEKALSAKRMWFERAANPDQIEYVFSVDEDDTTSAFLDISMPPMFGSVRIVKGSFKGSAPAWDAAAKASTGFFLIQAQDDLEPPQGWDRSLIEHSKHLITYEKEWRNGCPIPKITGYEKPPPFVIAVSDGYRKDDLMTVAICNRARYEQQGEFLHAGYQSMFSDDEFTIKALADAVDGKCVLIYARDLVFAHKNPYHTGEPQDATLRHQNSDAAYALGRRLFAERNSELLKRGLRTWK